MGWSEVVAIDFRLMINKKLPISVLNLTGNNSRLTQ